MDGEILQSTGDVGEGQRGPFYFPESAARPTRQAQATPRAPAPGLKRSAELDFMGVGGVRALAHSLRHKRGQLRLKRLMDVGGALIGLMLGSPVLVLAALLVRLSSGGPVIFKQRRVGFHQRSFVLYKFTTMRPEANPAWVAAQQAAAEQGVLVKTERDPRITRVGAILRATSVDELPQLFNVLKGDMSLVGPRPLLPFMLAPHRGFSRARSLVKPGITGLWQVRDRQHNTSALAMMPHDLEYVRRLSVGLDLAILWRTFGAVISRKGAC